MFVGLKVAVTMTWDRMQNKSRSTAAIDNRCTKIGGQRSVTGDANFDKGAPLCEGVRFKLFLRVLSVDLRP